MLFGAEHRRDTPRGGKFDLVALIIVDRKREQAVTVLDRACG
jgi:hypothetical protein